MICPHCGQEAPEDHIFCHQCGARLRDEETQPAAEEHARVMEQPGRRGREKTPWEDRDARGFFAGLFTTMNEVILRPSEFFKKMRVAGGLTDPLLYALIVGMIGLTFSYFWQILTSGAFENMIPGLQAGLGQNMLQGGGLALLAFFSPFIIIIGLFITAGILHLCLMLVNGARTGFEATFRVVSYGYSANILLAIPVCGSLLAAIWAVVLYVIGLREAHETTGGKAAFAVFLPAIACCGIVLFGIALLLGAAAGSLGSIIQLQK